MKSTMHAADHVDSSFSFVTQAQQWDRAQLYSWLPVLNDETTSTSPFKHKRMKGHPLVSRQSIYIKHRLSHPISFHHKG